MEWLNGPATSSGYSAARKKRSNFPRRPHPDPKSITHCNNVFTLNPSRDYGGHEDIPSYCLNGNSLLGADFERCSIPSANCFVSDENQQDGLGEAMIEYNRLGNENKLKKVKLKLGGVTRTLHTKPASEFATNARDFSFRGVGDAKDSSSRRAMYQESAPVDEYYKNELVRESKRVTKKRAMDEFDDEDDDEIRYLEKLRASKAAYGYGGRSQESGRKTKGIAKLMGLRHSDTRDEDSDYVMQLPSDDELKSKRKGLSEDFANPLIGAGQEMTMTTRKRALECPDSGGLVEFPNGLPPAPSKKKKLSEVERQLRKTEAAQRRRSQAEKAAKQAEAEAIRKILGQDSNRKKEEKLKKQQEELAQEKTAGALGPNTIRCIMGPSGTVVTFSEDIGLPKLFNSLPCRYPPPREKCAGPNCTNEYKYRDSKSKLPLCSLHCYKAVQGNMEVMPAC